MDMENDNCATGTAARHALGWLCFSNAIGVGLSALLLWPLLGTYAGEATYGRWVPVHLDGQLYGWTSLPLIVWLFSLYQVQGRSSGATAAIWAWSVSLSVGCLSWLTGESSGKIFLDWSNGSLGGILVAQVTLWLVLACAWWKRRKEAGAKRAWTAVGLVALLCVPVMLAVAASPETYPPIDRTTGGPTGASLLGSTLIVVLLLWLIPRTLRLERRKIRAKRWLPIVLWVIAMLAFVLLEWAGGTHGSLQQIAGLGLLLPWTILVPLDWRRFVWPTHSAFWKAVTQLWWAALVLSGWIAFLPGVLDRIKFTNGLVAHSHLAMAGFTTSLCLLLLSLVGGKRVAEAVNRGGVLWTAALAIHVIVLAACGWAEGGSFFWMDQQPWWRETAYAIRFACGVVMLLVSASWWIRSFPQTRTGQEGEL